jgi:hemolysin activation/secretion protein
MRDGMKRNKLRFFPAIWFSAALFLSSAAYSQGPSPQDIQNAIEQQRQILQQQEQRRQEQLRQLREQPAAPGEKIERPQAQADQSKVCVKVREIVFEGADLLDAAMQAQIRQPFVNSCMTMVDIISVARVVTNWYIGKGYVTTRAFPPAQDLKSGRLIIKVVEGYTEDVDVLTNGVLREKPTNAFPHIAGKRLNIRDIEQGLDQMNRLPTHDAKIGILPGQKDGFSRIQVDDTASGMPITISTVDNFGSSATGLVQLGNTVSIDDVFGLYDGWIFTHSTTAPFYDDKSSESYSASMTVPYGYWTFLLSASYFDYESRLVGNGVDSVTTGHTTNVTAEIDRVLHRDQNSKTRLAGFVGLKDTHNFTDGFELEVLSRKLTVAGIRLSHNTRFWGGIADLSLAGETGVPLFGSVADGDSEAEAAGAKAEFRKLSANLSYYKPFRLEDQVFAWQVRAKAQWSPDDLFSTEQLGVGGLYSVRGFRDESVSGDTGAYMRNELSWAVPAFISSPEIAKYFGAFKLFTALDAGWIHDDGSDEDHGALAGVAAGLRVQGGRFFGEVAWEKVISAPEFLEDEGDIFRAQAGLQVRW